MRHIKTERVNIHTVTTLDNGSLTCIKHTLCRPDGRNSEVVFMLVDSKSIQMTVSIQSINAKVTEYMYVLLSYDTECGAEMIEKSLDMIKSKHKELRGDITTIFNMLCEPTHTTCKCIDGTIRAGEMSLYAAGVITTITPSVMLEMSVDDVLHKLKNITPTETIKKTIIPKINIIVKGDKLKHVYDTVMSDDELRLFNVTLKEYYKALYISKDIGETNNQRWFNISYKNIAVSVLAIVELNGDVIIDAIHLKEIMVPNISPITPTLEITEKSVLVIVFGKSSFTLKNVDMVDIVLRDGINIGDDFYGIDDRDYDFLITTKETSNKYMMYIICMRTQETFIRTQHKKSTLSSIVDISHNNDITKKGGPATVNIQHNVYGLNIQRIPNTFIFDNLIATIKKEKDRYVIIDYKNQVPTMLPYEGIYQNGRYHVKLGDDTFTNMTQQEVQEALTLELHR